MESQLRHRFGNFEIGPLTRVGLRSSFPDERTLNTELTQKVRQNITLHTWQFGWKQVNKKWPVIPSSPAFDMQITDVSVKSNWIGIFYMYVLISKYQ